MSEARSQESEEIQKAGPEMVDAEIPSEVDAGTIVRPVLLVDAGVYRNYAVYLRRILVGLAGTAHASAVICPGDIETSIMDCPTVEKIEYPALRLGLFKATNQRILLERMARFKPTVIHTFSPGQVGLGALLSESLDVPFVATFHGRPRRWERCRKEVSHAARVLAPSAILAQRAAEFYPEVRERIELVPIGSYVEDECACFSRPNLPASLISVHSLDDASLFEPLLGAVRHLALDGFELMLVLMGSGKAERAIRRQIRSLGLAPVVTIVPPMRPLRTVLAGADVFLHVKDTSLFNAQMLEAMGVGLAVAGARDQTGGLLRDGQTAALWEGTDELSIYGCLRRLLGQRDAARRLALNGQDFLRQQCSVSCMVDRILSVYVTAQQEFKSRTAETTV
jgi:hypothetical protein